MDYCGTFSPLQAAHWLHAVPVNGTVLAVTVFSQIQVVLSCILLAATIFWTCIVKGGGYKNQKPLKTGAQVALWREETQNKMVEAVGVEPTSQTA
ncbi:uncharacterized protein METZ01_LOCUS371361 [marine metagenome]|uniref:Uncharacterized protein n=1 Tax=marine metagenome TaxID=408172 RepID=A0A382TAJ5_9ZZZZ